MPQEQETKLNEKYEKLLEFVKWEAQLTIRERDILARFEAGYWYYQSALDARKVLREIGVL